MRSVIAMLATSAGLLAGGCGGEDTSRPLGWLGAHASEETSSAVRLVYVAEQATSGDMIRADEVVVRPAGISFEITLRTRDGPPADAQRAIRRLECVRVELPRTTRVDRLRDGLAPSRPRRLSPGDREYADRPETDCPTVPAREVEATDGPRRARPLP